ncbi:SDR family NAD(P)-dependent oxidoreductase [Cupriavidus sp. IDO]|uniref:SDR family NAD(P)-dependent oxidoreductase n=1 Tax=Cupriavidus sp. IDO TaxID=1539142 RepID=UPI0005796A53|nr:SDR family NAD(P)-dependent oxidoreductase [Cupriavidus sp. IDO]KWR86631.1 short-chain dehydrogenase [Cupriavidus sp. IDO]
MKLKNRVAIVTGGASGIGAATVRRFVAEGATVVLTDLSERGELLAHELAGAGHAVRFSRVDVTREHEVRELVAAVALEFGQLDIMVANAGIAQQALPVESLTSEAWHQMLDVNLTGVFFSNKYAIAQMKRQGGGGAVVNIASVLGHVGRPGATAYNAAKGGVVNMTRSLGVACAKEGIRVNAVCPGFIETPLIAGASDESLAQVTGLHPIGRLGRAEEIAAAITFLASDDASFMAGASLMVDGGYAAQ